MKLIKVITKTYRDAFAGLPRLVWILAGGALVNRAGTMVLPFLSLYLTRDFGLSVEKAGIVVAVFGLGAMVGSFVGGRLSDRFGAIRILLVSLGLSGGGFIVLGQLQSFPAMIAGVFVVSMISEAFRPAMMAAVALASPTECRPRAFALIRLAVNLGMAAGPAIAGILASISYRWLFVVDGVTCWAAGVVLFAAISREALRPESPPKDGKPVVSPWQDGPFLVLLALVFLMAVALLQVWITFPIYLREVYGFGERGVGFLMAFNAGLIVLFEMVLLHVIEQYDHLKVAGVGAVLICLGLGLLPLGTGIAFAIVLTCVWTLGEMLNLPMVNAVVASRAGRQAAGRYMGAYSLSFATAFVVSPLIGSAVYQRLGPSVLWFGIGCSGLFLFFGFHFLSRRFR